MVLHQWWRHVSGGGSWRRRTEKKRSLWTGAQSRVERRQYYWAEAVALSLGSGGESLPPDHMVRWLESLEMEWGEGRWNGQARAIEDGPRQEWELGMKSKYICSGCSSQNWEAARNCATWRGPVHISPGAPCVGQLKRWVFPALFTGLPCLVHGSSLPSNRNDDGVLPTCWDVNFGNWEVEELRLEGQAVLFQLVQMERGKPIRPLGSVRARLLNGCWTVSSRMAYMRGLQDGGGGPPSLASECPFVLDWTAWWRFVQSPSN